jgi:cell division protein FtsA
MEKIIYTGIDIGSKNLKFMSIEFTPESNKTRVLHKERYPSNGITDGYISNPDLFNQSLIEALKKYKRDTRVNIDEVIISIDSLDLKSKNLKIIHDIANQANITDLDIAEIERKINSHAKKNIQGEIIDSRLVKYKINNYNYYSDIEGLNAKKITAEYLFSYLPVNHITTLEKVLTKNDISILNLFSGNSISSEINLDKNDKNLGVINIDIGADITSISI